MRHQIGLQREHHFAMITKMNQLNPKPYVIVIACIPYCGVLLAKKLNV
jgi:hypothetical protein